MDVSLFVEEDLIGKYLTKIIVSQLEYERNPFMGWVNCPPLFVPF
jgi:hypothetical protein